MPAEMVASRVSRTRRPASACSRRSAAAQIAPEGFATPCTAMSGAVDRLDERGKSPIRIRVGGRSDPNRPGDGRRGLGEQIPQKVRADDYVEALRLKNDLGGRGVGRLDHEEEALGVLDVDRLLGHLRQRYGRLVGTALFLGVRLEHLLVGEEPEELRAIRDLAGGDDTGRLAGLLCLLEDGRDDIPVLVEADGPVVGFTPEAIEVAAGAESVR